MIDWRGENGKVRRCTHNKSMLVGRSIRRTIIASSFLALLMCIDCVTLRADQLAFNSRQVCQEAANELKPGSFLVSYCSKCDNEFVEIWQIRDAVVVYTGQGEFYQVDIFCRKLYRTAKSVAVGGFSDSLSYEELSAGVYECEDLYTLEEVDPAYIYVGTRENSYQCLGKKLGLKCDVLVDNIMLPEDIATRLQSLSRSATH